MDVDLKAAEKEFGNEIYLVIECDSGAIALSSDMMEGWSTKGGGKLIEGGYGVESMWLGCDVGKPNSYSRRKGT